ncbi:flagellar biosynthetic protein FlhB [Gluconobacter thailandicus NBRC 3257]|uniref:Flagellar biosynthetic protein FlhB n=1 Tax=Gluconobacter thailandicus NBRC 3257 TaxID=1381097 RepID=A0ABQ0IXA9_GLUTH|nr:EscU/YscU/HrcU family type III secretion system export apparatus switch protein [Gluconobacter thailandicus]KXV54423.1 flagellar biosynthesis protein FlhB [Gluconobacter thailandicus]GAC89409.1 flagellar biosynthetic protein FlhB [Gluconobacter thailandicus NBRC 3255]GAD26842.1 flagellar biosynthetic protein FlhB [Gluconobacter thailandicus NBRC 3257]
MADAEDRTEAPSQQRLQKARDDGQIVLSREAMSFTVLLSGILGVFTLLPFLIPDFVHSMQGLMANAGTVSMVQGGLLAATEHCIIAGLKLVIPVAGLVTALTLTAGFLQTGFLVHPASLLPKMSRVSPMGGLTRILGGGTLPDTFKALAKLVIFTTVLWHLAKGVIPDARSMTGLTTSAILTKIAHLGLSGAISMALAQLVIAGGDIFWMRFRHTAKLKMSREELKEEYRNTEGDPHVKGRLKALRARRAKQRMMEAVKTATVVVTNPTHYSVALVYEKGASSAPKIVAKGMDDMAARIREAAQDHRVPIVANPPLARALFPLPLDSEIPAEHFKVVAAIIAYVWKLKRPGSRSAPIQ